MAKRFNTTGSCNPDIHYMVNIDDKLAQIKTLIDEGHYFTINRARQFGKTTTMKLLAKKLRNDYIVIPISFEGVGGLLYKDETSFCTKFKEIVENAFSYTTWIKELELWNKLINVESLDVLSISIAKFCSSLDKKFVLLIDEVDKSTDNQLFLHFLGMLRNMYLDRDTKGINSTFYSVILAGVYDVKNLKLKIRSDEERKYNSPWNIAVRFNVDMTFDVKGIKGMLDDYEADYHTGMNTQLIAEEIHKYTSGYPFLVSFICSLIHEELQGNWTIESVQKAVKVIVNGENITLVDDISKNLENYENLRDFMYSLSINGEFYPYTVVDSMVKFAAMFSYIKNDNGIVKIHNLIFDEIFHLFFTIRFKRENPNIVNPVKSEYILNGKLNMPYVIERFKDLMYEEYRKENGKFIEREARLLFLCFLKPIINGTGFYYVEPQTRDNRRMDIIVTYAGEEFIIELKMWYGRKYEQNGKVQLAEYLTSKNKDKGYLVTFSFLKEKANQAEPEWVEQDGKQIYEAIIDVNVGE